MARKRRTPGLPKWEGIEFETDPTVRRQRVGATECTARAVRRAGILRRLREGKHRDTICEEMGLKQRTYYRDLNFIKSWALRDAKASFNEMLDDIRAENDILKREMIAAYEKSKKGRRVVKSGVPVDGAEGPSGLEITTYESYGDPAYIDRALKINDQLIRILELETDPKNAPDLRDTPPVWYLEVADREDVKAFEEAVEFEELAEKIRSGSVNPGRKEPSRI